MSTAVDLPCAACRAALRSHRCPAPCRAVPSRSAARCCSQDAAVPPRRVALGVDDGCSSWLVLARRQLRKLGPAHAVIASATELIPESVARNGVPTIAQAYPLNQWVAGRVGCSGSAAFTAAFATLVRCGDTVCCVVVLRHIVCEAYVPEGHAQQRTDGPRR